MARELGMNPKKFGKVDNHHQEPWKASLPIFVEDLYFKRFGRERPETIISIEKRARQLAAKKQARRAEKAARRPIRTSASRRPDTSKRLSDPGGRRRRPRPRLRPTRAQSFS
jgi:hypothetical protein